MKSSPDLVGSFVRISEEYGRELRAGNKKAVDRRDTKLTDTFSKLTQQKGGVDQLLPFLESSEPWVRFCVARALIEIYPFKSIDVLESIVSEFHGNELAAMAGGVIWFWRRAHPEVR